MNEEKLAKISLDKNILQLWLSRLMNVEVKGQSGKILFLTIQEIEDLIIGNISKDEDNGN